MRSHNLIVPSAEQVVKEVPPGQPLAAHAREGSCMCSHDKLLTSHTHALCETSTQDLVPWIHKVRTYMPREHQQPDRKKMLS